MTRNGVSYILQQAVATTTHVYLEADLATKEQALQKLAPAGKEVPRFKATDEVLAFLAAL